MLPFQRKLKPTVLDTVISHLVAQSSPLLAGGAYVPTFFGGMYAPSRKGADMPHDGTSAPPVISATLRRQAHAAQQLLEARVGAQRVEDGIDMKKRKPAAIALLVSPVKPLEDLVPSAQSQKHKSVC